MLRSFAALVGCVSVLVLSGCATTTPVSGILYADVKGPVTATSNTRGTAKGMACATAYLGLVALGDASITMAAKAGGIGKISHVEHHTNNILGVVTKYCTWVWGWKTGAKAGKAESSSEAEEL